MFVYVLRHVLGDDRAVGQLVEGDIGVDSVGEAAEGLARLRHLARRERRDRIGEAGQRRGDAADPLRVAGVAHAQGKSRSRRSEEHTSELQSLMRISYAVFCLKKKT